MRLDHLRAGLVGVSLAGSLALGCGGNPAPPRDGGTDGMAIPTDAGDSGTASAMCPIATIPMATQQFGACCYRVSQEDHQDAPELRLRSLALAGPAGSALVLPIPTGQLLNASLANETFNWLFRVTGADADGPVEIETGFGTRDATTGTYAFSTMPRYAPIMLNGTLTGETITTEASPTGLIVPVFDPTGEILQVELSLHGVELVTSEFNDHRSCVGTIGARYMYQTGAQLTGFLLVSEARAGMINVASIHAELCTLIASPNLGDPDTGPYCEQPQGTWEVRPDALCTGETCVQNGTGADVCSEDGTGSLPLCNAWLLVANFAAVGIDIVD
jgi:hypothetical protein